ncbi:MAG: hypothetical protein C4529_12115 [Deltaproteobacteria bacterium]|nr:MAG: hypothetical protein C4529_12115 [Deltaproteobacteria bacterium]
MSGIHGPGAVRRFLHLAVPLIALIFLVSVPLDSPAAASGATSAPEDPARVHLRAIVRPKFPLLSVKEHAPGRPEGMAIDLLEAIGRDQGISFTWVVLSADADLEDALRRGEGDIAADWGGTTVRSR